MSKKVSVIVPVYNVEDYLERCVGSIIGQNYQDLEIILVNDGSTDSSGIICDNLAQKDNRIRVIHKQNEGLGYARNSGLDVANGQYIFFVDSDDYIMPGIIKELVTAVTEYQADVASCGYKSGKKEYYVYRKAQILTGIEATDRMFTKSGIDANAVCKLYRHELFDTIRYPKGVHESSPVTYKIINTGVVGYYIEKRENSITRVLFGQNNIVNIDRAYIVYQDINHKHEELAESAYAYYLATIISAMENAEADKKTNIHSYEYQTVKQLFDKNFNYIFRSKLSVREKTITILIKSKLYRIIKRIYRKVRG